MSIIESVKRNWWYYAALLIIIIIALSYRGGAISNFIIPTWGNTMYHVGIERETINTGYYPQYELSYGGGFPNFYVPAYRLLVSSLSIATGIDPMPMSGLIVLLLGLFCLLAVYIVAYRLSGNNYYVALFAAFFFLVSPDITINTERPFPELMGLFILPLALYFIYREDWLLATLAAIIMALTHQQSVLALVAIMGTYSVLQLAYAALYTKKYKKALWSFVPTLAACATIASWLIFSTGSLNFLKIAQLAYHEQWPVTLSTIVQTGTFVLIFFVIGLVYLYGRPLLDVWRKSGSKKDAVKQNKRPEKGYNLNITVDARLLLAAWMIASIVLSKNELIHILSFQMNTLQSRFYTYFVDAAIVLAGFGMYALLSMIDFKPLLEKPE